MREFEEKIKLFRRNWVSKHNMKMTKSTKETHAHTHTHSQQKEEKGSVRRFRKMKDQARCLNGKACRPIYRTPNLTSHSLLPFLNKSMQNKNIVPALAHKTPIRNVRTEAGSPHGKNHHISQKTEAISDKQNYSKRWPPALVYFTRNPSVTRA